MALPQPYPPTEIAYTDWNTVIDALEAILGTGAAGPITVDTISEKTAAAGVTIDGVLLKDNTVTASSLTAGRIPFASTGGLLVDDADFTFSVDTLTVTKIAATTFTGQVTISRSGTGSSALWAQVTGDANPRFKLFAGGNMQWGDGTNAPDAQLSRTAANVLSLGSGDSFGATTFSGQVESTVAAGSPVFKVILTNDSPTATWSDYDSNDYVVSTAPAGWIEILVGSTPYYIPVWA